ncbi:sugar phosphate isomerase/epimerase family protein [Streptomyces sp. NPDC057428]|uniref:sugar phosphate isomerase/epimerase family protein n=1 Tax=Streptomyces sp. NPDC057428 TaxID=3346129 RepID=UPI00367D9201
MSVNIRVANAPVNFGIYAADRAPFTANELLSALAEAGYEGIDSGPIGYLGTVDTLPGRLADAGLALAGGWIDLRYGAEDGFSADQAGLEAALDVFTAVPVPDPVFAPRPTLACPDNAERMARPGIAYGTVEDWAGFAARVQRAADRCRERGLEPVFHHHLGTDVESAQEVEKLLEATDVSLCLDTGHLYLAGGDPLAALRDWAPRIKQVHIKDASREAMERTRAAGGDFAQAVRDGAFPVLGTGEIEMTEVVAVLQETGYTGWAVIEQDAPETGREPAGLLADQRTNREALRKAGL